MSDWLTVAQLGYPFAPVGPDAVGGAEQVLTALDEGLTLRGHRSLVVAPVGSRCHGELWPIPALPAPAGPADWDNAAFHVRRTLNALCAALRVDLLHVHAYGFERLLPADGPPVLVTLHLPVSWYVSTALRPSRNVLFNCVSASQHATLPPDIQASVIPNGIALDRFRPTVRKRGYALMLGRVCPEKGQHLAIAAAAAAGVPLIIAGQLFPYPEHVAYFEQRIRPHLGPRCRFVGPVGFARKRRLLAGARCLLVPSLVPETSCLVAREALASGTPVVAFRSGALAETIVPGVTGYLVDTVEQMGSALADVPALSPEDCRRSAENFGLEPMIDGYLRLYAALTTALETDSPVRP